MHTEVIDIGVIANRNINYAKQGRCIICCLFMAQQH